MKTTKLQLTDSTQDVLFKMSEGNPGALNVLMKMLMGADRIDPDGALGGLGAILMLDSMGLYGSKIWMLYKDVCGHDLPKLLAVIRAWQLGIADDSQIRMAVENRGNGLDLDNLCAQVAKELPRFQFTQEPVETAP